MRPRSAARSRARATRSWTEGGIAVSATHGLRVPIEGMTCASCVGRVERALARLPGVESVQVNLATETARLRSAQALDVAAVAQAVADAGYALPTRTLDLAIEGMTCASCVGRVERALGRVPGVLQANVNLATERAAVRAAASVDHDALVQAIEQAGYHATRCARPSRHPHKRHRTRGHHELPRQMMTLFAAGLPHFTSSRITSWTFLRSTSVA